MDSFWNKRFNTDEPAETPRNQGSLERRETVATAGLP